MSPPPSFNGLIVTNRNPKTLLRDITALYFYESIERMNQTLKFRKIKNKMVRLLNGMIILQNK